VLQNIRLAQRHGLLAIMLVLILSATLARASAQAPTEPAWRLYVRHLAETSFKHPAWGYSHSVRDYDLARALAAADHVTLDDDIIFAAAYLHDIGGFPPWAKPKEDHQDVGAEAVAPILAHAGFPKEKLAAVQGAIRTHMYTRDPVGPEAVYLHDADALDWLGDIGAARLFSLVDPAGGRPTGQDAVSALQKYLKDVPPRVLSPAGRALAFRRSDELERFLDGLGSESDKLKAL